MTQEFFRQIRLIDPTQGLDAIGDLFLVDGVIRAIAWPASAGIAVPRSKGGTEGDLEGDAEGLAPQLAPQLDLPPNTQVHDGSGLILAPGLVDLYSRSGEPGHEERETLASLTAAATAGGFSRVALLPTTTPAIDNPAQLARQRNFRPQPGQTQLQFWAALTQGAEGQQMSDLQELSEAGAVGFSDGRPLASLALLSCLLDYAQPLKLPIALWARDLALAGHGIAREGRIALQLGLPGDPETSETVALAALIECVRTSGTPVHCMRLSTARGVELIRQAKAEQIPITASVSWLHLLFNSRDLQSYDPCLRLQPPLGNPGDQAALLAAVKAGIIDGIAIDHSPYRYEEKTVAFGLAPPGAIGLSLALPILWQRLIVNGDWTALTLWERLSAAPARCLQQTPPSLELGQSEWLLFDPQASWEATPPMLPSLSANSPWLGRKILGKVMRLQTPI